jgi:hypothetical protein
VRISLTSSLAKLLASAKSEELLLVLKDSSVRTPYKIRVDIIFVGEQLHGCREIIG